MSSRMGVGIVGAGFATQAIHVPTLATLADRFRIVSVMDVDATAAEKVASATGARGVATVAELLEDPAVDVVAICSPHKFHADQLVSACRAGKRGIMCEKALATSFHEANAVGTAAAETGTPVVVGAMHVYDPAVRAAFARWGALGEKASFIHSVIYLPSNDVFIRQATEPLSAPPPPSGGTASSLPSDGDQVRGAILDLATHTISLVRTFASRITSLGFARSLSPWGYGFGWTAGDALVEMYGMLPGAWGPDWSLRIVGQRHEMRISFPPSYVLAGSARAEIVGRDGTEAWEFGQNGYQALWAELHAEVMGRDAIVPFVTAVDDLRFALTLADLADELLSGNATCPV